MMSNRHPKALVWASIAAMIAAVEKSVDGRGGGGGRISGSVALALPFDLEEEAIGEGGSR